MLYYYAKFNKLKLVLKPQEIYDKIVKIKEETDDDDAFKKSIKSSKSVVNVTITPENKTKCCNVN